MVCAVHPRCGAAPGIRTGIASRVWLPGIARLEGPSALATPGRKPVIRCPQRIGFGMRGRAMVWKLVAAAVLAFVALVCFGVE